MRQLVVAVALTLFAVQPSFAQSPASDRAVLRAVLRMVPHPNLVILGHQSLDLACAVRSARRILYDPIDIDGETMPEVRAAWFPYTMPFNLTGHPAITLPVGLASDGLPLAVQLVGRFRRDVDMLALAATLEARVDWNGRIAGEAS
jgi:Asp-tRNA(Asn)/Glu-tRNA(Gln) amidotransferase A subunit family amidase